MCTSIGPSASGHTFFDVASQRLSEFFYRQAVAGEKVAGITADCTLKNSESGTVSSECKHISKSILIVTSGELLLIQNPWHENHRRHWPIYTIF